MVAVLLTGLSGAGKTTLVAQLRARGHVAVDADDDGYTEPAALGEWTWRTDAVAALLSAPRSAPLFFAGCSEEQGRLPFDLTVLLTAPAAVLHDRLAQRTGNPCGKDAAERARALAYVTTVEPLLRASADLVVDTTRPPRVVADEVLAWVSSRLDPLPPSDWLRR